MTFNVETMYPQVEERGMASGRRLALAADAYDMKVGILGIQEGRSRTASRGSCGQRSEWWHQERGAQ